MYEWGDIQNIVEHRRSNEGPTKKKMIDVRDRYKGDYVIPLPSVEGMPEMDPPAPRLIADGIDGTAMSAASTRPVIHVPAIDDTKERGVRSREYAGIRRRAYYATWYKSQVNMLIRKQYRFLAGYGEMAFVVVPDFEEGIPRIEIRDPLTSYPEERTTTDIRRPENAAFVFGRSSEWIKKRYPEASRILGEHTGIWDLVEWIDHDYIVIGLLGPRNPPYHLSQRVREGEFSIELRRWPNRSGRCPVACTRRVTLEGVAGQVYNIIGHTDLLAKMMALDVLAAEKAIFPDRFVIGADGRPPQLLSGPWKDGRTGKTNILSDVTSIGELTSSPGPLTHPVMDRLESAARQSGGIHPFFSGLQPGSNLRTGRAIDNFGAFTMEPRLAEMQESMAMSLSIVNEAIHDCYKGYWGSKKYTIFSGWPTDMGHVEFTPKDHFESDANVVSYEFPGTDAAGAAVTIGQLVASRMESRRTGMTQHPYVRDADQEMRTILEEELEAAVLAGIQSQAAEGVIPIIDLARIKQLAMQGYSIEEAVRMADEEARERQVTEAPPPAEGQVAAPQAAPGLAPPGVGAESPEALPSVQPPDQGIQNLRQLLVSLRRQ